MNIIKIKTPLYLIMLLSVCLADNERSEMTDGFTRTDYKREKNTNSVLPSADPKKDMPELFERKQVYTESSRSDSVLTEINGYRVQLFRTEDLDEAKSREAMFVSDFGEENVALVFEKPFYKIRAGRFRDKEEAEQFQQMLGRRGISDTIIIPDRVRLLMPVKK